MGMGYHVLIDQLKSNEKEIEQAKRRYVYILLEIEGITHVYERVIPECVWICCVCSKGKVVIRGICLSVLVTWSKLDRKSVV